MKPMADRRSPTGDGAARTPTARRADTGPAHAHGRTTPPQPCPTHRPTPSSV